MAMIRWPLPYDHEPNGYEIVGRYITQTLFMERFVDMLLLANGANPQRLIRKTLSDKISEVGKLIDRPGSGLEEWHDLPEMMRKVAKNRNRFVHHTLSNSGHFPSHYGQGIPVEAVSNEQLREQEREAFMASEVCRQLLERFSLEPLNPGMHVGRRDPDWAEVLERHARLTAQGH